jgi:hypothetical protein
MSLSASNEDGPTIAEHSPFTEWSGIRHVSGETFPKELFLNVYG